MPPSHPTALKIVWAALALSLLACGGFGTPRATTPPLPTPGGITPGSLPFTPTPGASPTPLIARPTPTPTSSPTPSATPTVTPTAQAYQLPFAYGWDIAMYNAYQPTSGAAQYSPTSFGWLKLVGEPGDPAYLCGTFRLPYKVLFRLSEARASNSAAQVAAHARRWAESLRGCVEAFEIGGNLNLGGPGQYDGPVNPEHYADQLCAAYDAIKAVDPKYLVISGGFGATGGETELYLDEEKYTQRLLAQIQATRGHAGACFDAFGYQSFGYRTGYATDPTDAARCPDGMCFRGVERVHELLVAAGVAQPIWITGTAWMRDYVAGGCGSAAWAGVFGGFANSDQAQADNLVGAFKYARANWPWLKGLFVVSLDYNRRPWATDLCQDADNWFAVKGSPAEAALEAMAKP